MMLSPLLLWCDQWRRCSFALNEWKDCMIKRRWAWKRMLSHDLVDGSTLSLACELVI